MSGPAGEARLFIHQVDRTKRQRLIASPLFQYYLGGGNRLEGGGIRGDGLAR